MDHHTTALFWREETMTCDLRTYPFWLLVLYVIIGTDLTQSVDHFDASPTCTPFNRSGPRFHPEHKLEALDLKLSTKIQRCQLEVFFGVFVV